MKKRVFLIFLALVLAMSVTMTGCKKKGSKKKDHKKSEESADGEESEDEDEEEFEEEEVEYTSEYGPLSGGAEWGNNCEGSAVYTEGTTAVVTVTIDSEDEPFDDGDIATMKKNAKTALDFIVKTAGEYGKKTEFVFDQDDLNFSYVYDDVVEDLEFEDYDLVLKKATQDLDKKAIMEKYNAQGIAYLVLLNAAGDPFYQAHMYDDETDLFNEAAFVFRDSYDEDYDEVTSGPDVYLYELLHLFGAIELDYPDATYGYTAALLSTVLDSYNNDIMLGYYQDDGSINPDEVTKEITDITAYCIGLVDDFEELNDNPTLKREYKCTLEDRYFENTNNGQDTSAYEADSEDMIYMEGLEDEEIDEVDVDELMEDAGAEKTEN
ncbi:MAG: hypothetical protein IJM23_03490 [Lachnospiraceae bacterium]|nr:hypothetical protein [Lachnospiraceae bacterium]